MAWTQNIDDAAPLDTDLVSGGAAQLRNLKEAVLERMNSIFADFNAQPLVANGFYWGLTGAGAPTSGGAGTGAGVANPGSEYFDTTNKICYKNINTKASPTWAPVLMGDSI